jgi:imidazolonepropionase-like amidohydrolase
MNELAIVTQSYFDGHRYHNSGPYTIAIADGRIASIRLGASSDPTLTAPFAMPGLVEAHCHLFLDGAELDVNKRKDHLAAPR